MNKIKVEPKPVTGRTADGRATDSAHSFIPREGYSVEEIDELGAASMPAGARDQVSSTAQLMGYLPYVPDESDPDSVFWIRPPKIAAEEQFQQRYEKYMEMPEEQKLTREGRKQAVRIVMPLLRRKDAAGKWRQVTEDECFADLDIPDVAPIMQLAMPIATPQEELQNAGIDDPNSTTPASPKTGDPSMASSETVGRSITGS